MKVYVDIDDTRKITTYHDGLGTQQGLYVYGKDKIEVLSLADYTKQVRKEVCEVIWGGFVGLNNLNGNYEYKKFEDDFRKFLDQIEQGETKWNQKKNPT